MNPALYRRSAPWWLGLCLCLLLLVVALRPAAAAPSPSPGTTVTFPSLPELLRKWADVSFEAVQRAAESGDREAQHYLAYCYAEGLRVAADPALGVRWYERAGQAGYLPSWNNLGVLYQRGKGVPQDQAKALEYYRRAAEAGLPRAQANLGLCYKDGRGVPPDPVAAMRWFRLAADNGLPTGMVEVGRLYRFGEGVAQDADTAAAWFQKAADKGDPLGAANLGLLYEAEGNSQRALPFFRRAATAGNLDAMVWLYLTYAEGRAGPEDMTEAMKWLNQAVQGGNAYAQCLLGYRHEHPDWERSSAGDRLPPPNMPEAARWYRRSAEQNWSGGQYHLGLCYLAGTGVDQDEELGLEFIRKAADQSQIYAMLELANLYTRGIGAPRSAADHPLRILQRLVAIKWEKETAPFAEAYEALVLRYEHGIGCEPDLLAAVEWHCRAAVAGFDNFSLSNSAAQPPRLVGVCFRSEPGRGIIAVTVPDTPNRSEAFLALLSVYLKAARGDAQAALQIAQACLEGADTPKSSRTAWLWFSLAARNGAPQARDELAQCQARLSGEELQAAQQQWPDFLQTLTAVGRTASLPDRRPR